MKTTPKPELPKARAMTRREWLAFKASGKDPVDADVKNTGELLKIQSAAYDWIITNIYDAEELADVPMNDLNRLAEKTYWLTYGRGEEAEKN